MGHGFKVLSLSALLIAPLVTNAALIDRGGGMIYDTVLNITWMQDGNYAMTSGYSETGLMDWTAAMTWADQLNYGGYSDWRLPETKMPDPTCRFDGSVTYQNCTGSEMGNLFYVTLGNVSATTDPIGYGLVNSGPFFNLHRGHGYRSTEYSVGSPYAWYFHFDNGFQASSEKTSQHYAWAVRDGDSVSVPEPGTLALLGLGLLGLGVTRRRQYE